MTLTDIASHTSVSITKISDFENGKCQLASEVLEELYQFLGISYVYDFKRVQRFYSLFYLFYRNIFYQDDYEASYRELESMKPYIVATVYYPQFLLAEFVYHVFERIPYEFENTIETIELLLDCLDDNQKQIYFDSAGVYYKNQMNIKQALVYFDKASIYGYAPATAMMLYHKGSLLDMNNELTKALECLKQARTYFLEQINIKRILLSSGAIANIYRRLGFYEDAIHLTELCLPHMKVFDLKGNILVAYNNITWSYLLMKDYEASIRYAYQTLELAHYDVKSYFFLAYAYAHKNDDKKAREMIRLAKQYAKQYGTTSYMQAMVSAYHTILSDQKPLDTKVKKLKLVLAEKEAKVDLEARIFLLELMIELLEPSKRKKELDQYRKELSECFRKRK